MIGSPPSLPKTLSSSTMGFGWTGTAALLPNWMKYLHSSWFWKYLHIEDCLDKDVAEIDKND